MGIKCTGSQCCLRRVCSYDIIGGHIYGLLLYRVAYRLNDASMGVICNEAKPRITSFGVTPQPAELTRCSVIHIIIITTMGYNFIGYMSSIPIM